MKKTKRFISALLTCAMCLAMASCGGNSTPNNPGSATGDKSNAPATGDNTVYTLSWAHSSSTNDRLALATEKMAEELKEASNGRLIIEHYPASQLGAERETLEGITLGTVDCAVISSGIVAGFSEDMYITSMPYLIDDYETGWAVYDGEFGKELGRRTEEDAGWKFLGWCDNSLRMFSNSKKEIQTPTDMAGLKIRTQENDLHMQLVNALGASATPVAFSELYTALQQGTVDGQENGIALTYSMGFNEVVKYMTYFPHIYDPYIVVMSSEAWNKLPADLQALMEEYGAKYCQYEREFNLQNEKDYLAEMEGKGLKVYYPTDEQKQLFVDATADVEAAIRGKVGDDLVDSFKAAVADVKG
ncbi:MAG: DctP family TRAP transporter solute-binding subunit [Lawsonibacter sp.]|jgi:tripartite ATP-independent transporter DctP family solute receptor|nr:DctP family TRAP transporter solute-binding subunit [Lawsonibacter sp.]